MVLHATGQSYSSSGFLCLVFGLLVRMLLTVTLEFINHHLLLSLSLLFLSLSMHKVCVLLLEKKMYIASFIRKKKAHASLNMMNIYDSTRNGYNYFYSSSISTL